MTSDQLHSQLPEPINTDGPKPLPPPYLAYVGINEAARLVGKAKQQIYRDIEAGKLSWHVEESGKKLLQIADLDRLYKLKPKNATGSETGIKNQRLLNENTDVPTSKATEIAVEVAVLRERVAAKEEALRQAHNEIHDLRQNRDNLFDQNKRLTMLLTSPLPLAEETPKPEPSPTPRSFWQRLFPPKTS